MSTCNRLDLQTLGSQPVRPENLPDHCMEAQYYMRSRINDCVLLRTIA